MIQKTNVTNALKKNTMLIALFAVMIMFQIMITTSGRGSLFAPANISNLINQNSYVVILATGMLLCILTGGNIDLSVGSIVAVVGAVAGTLIVNMHMNIYLAMVFCLLTGIAMSVFGKSYGTNISGSLFLNGKEVILNSVKDAIEHHLAYVTEDRKGNGLILSNPIRENTTLSKLEKVSKHEVLDTDLEQKYAVEYAEKLSTKCSSVSQLVSNLSGGNQQKILLSKWMFADPDVLILDEPTRGIDVGAKYEIYCIINTLVAEGKSVLLISSEMPEILGMCDRIYVMNEGKIVGEFPRETASQEAIMFAIMKSGKGE